MTTYILSSSEEASFSRGLLGVGLGTALGFLLVGFDLAFKRFNLRSFNVAIVGIFIGYLMGQALVFILSAILSISKASIALHPQTLEIIKISLFLFGTYLGTLMTWRASDELYVSIPFVKLSLTSQKKKYLIIDQSVLFDPRIVDFCATGILDHSLVVPRFIIKELYAFAELGDEMAKIKPRKAIETFKKLEGMPGLDLKINDTDFPDIKELCDKTLRLARLLDANLLTSEMGKVQTSSFDKVKIINLHTLSTALKPLMQGGESIKIRVQRTGKEPKQGVGYLEDGTMVVINGGGAYLSKTVDAKVLSVKHTVSGRMIFCNLLDDDHHHTETTDMHHEAHYERS